jgi:DNA adenine methylase
MQISKWFSGGEGVTTNPGMVQLSLYPKDAVPERSIIPKASPFVKWAGGKRKLLNHIVSAAPVRFSRYLEPFVGGGALALALGHSEMLINDSNIELINAYRIVRDNLGALISFLDGYQRRHSKENYYMVRAQDPASLHPIEQAARFIYLNKTCFNGLYRVNKQGQFNVPFGKYKHAVLYKKEDLQVVSNVLQSAKLFAEDYQTFLKQQAQPGDFIYLDPPYVPISQYSDFKRYTKEQFRENDQHILAEVYNELVELGAYPVLSNSYSKLTLDLYARHQILVVYASRNINHEGNGRDPIPEILVKPR